LSWTIVAFFVYGSQPKLGASTADLLSFFHGHRTRILIATVVFCFSSWNCRRPSGRLFPRRSSERERGVWASRLPTRDWGSTTLGRRRSLSSSSTTLIASRLRNVLASLDLADHAVAQPDRLFCAEPNKALAA
jgi:hypothetical protein